MIIINKNEWPFTIAQNSYCIYSAVSTTLSPAEVPNIKHFRVYFAGLSAPQKKPGDRPGFFSEYRQSQQYEMADNRLNRQPE